MSLRRKITLVFLLVNVITLVSIVWLASKESSRVKERLDADRLTITGRTADIVGLTFKNSMEQEFSRILARGESRGRKPNEFDEFEMALAISDLAYWDDDPIAKEHLERAVLVRLGPLDVNRFNPRPRLIFENKDRYADWLDKGGLRERLGRSRRVEKEFQDNGSVLVYGMMDPEVAKDWGFLFHLKPPKPLSFGAERVREALLWIAVPSTLFLILFLYVFFSRSVLRPLVAAERAALHISKGDYSHRMAGAEREDEIGRVAQSMNSMMRDLEKYRDHMEGLVEEANARFVEAEKGLVVAERLAAMGRIAAGIAHEINNPLGGILNAINRLGQADLPADRRKKYYELAEESVRRIQKTVQRVLAATPRGETRVQVLRLLPLVEQARGLVTHRLKSEGIAIDLEIAPDFEILGDPNELSQVFLNLLINALDASQSGDRIEVRASLLPDESARIEVSDQGEGMTPEVKERIFDLFYTTKPGNKGTGLGLGIVHNIVTGHGGHITVESAPGRGSRFEIIIPKPGRSPLGGGSKE